MPRITSYRKKYKTWGFKKILRFFILICLIGAIFIIALLAYFAKDLPNPEELTGRTSIESTKIYDRTGRIILYDIHGEEKRTIIPFEEMPQNLREATIVAEDSNFYHHFGLDFKGIARALLSDLKGKKISQGGSTITQQFIKNVILTPERTLSRKIREAILSIEMELKYSKDEILGFYLNQVPYGSNAYGVEAAAQTFFSKKANDLTLAESAILASLTKATTYYSPYGSHLEDLKTRQEYILDRMQQFGYITEEELNQAKKEEIRFAPASFGIKAPHFVMYIREYLEDKYGKDYIEKSGLKVYTTLDWDFQQIAEQIVLEQVNKNIKNFNANNAALVAIDPRTGQILAMVGSKDYFGEPSPSGCIPGKNCLFEPNVNVAIRPRQPGSSFKPFAYATAFKKGFTPDTVVFDLKTEFNPNCSADGNQGKDQYGLECYHPKNYNGKFSGPVILRNALAQSLNVPSVKTLYLAGVNETINTAQDMGINTLKDRSRYGLSLVLGGGEVKLIEETSAYGVFANDGIKNYPTAILKIETNKGEILEEYKNKPVKVLEPQIARLISNILSDENARAPIFGSNSKLYIKERPTAVKTGTTQEYRDGWTVGFTPSLVVGVWAGNNNNTPMKNGDGSAVAAPIWNKFFKEAYIKKQEMRSKEQETNNYFDLPEQAEEFIKPEIISANKDVLNGKFTNELIVNIDIVSGKLATNLTPPETIEEKIYYQIHSILYYLNKDHPQEEEDGKNDLLFNNWESPILKWIETLTNKETYNQQPPTEYDDFHLPTIF